MSRYACNYDLPISIEEIPQILINILESCNFKMDFQSKDYLMAKDTNKDKNISFSRLVKVEIILNVRNSNSNHSSFELMVTNQKLAVNKNNYALERMSELKQKIFDIYIKIFLIFR